MRAISSWAKSITPAGCWNGPPATTPSGCRWNSSSAPALSWRQRCPLSSSATTSTSFAVWRARRRSGISTALIHSSCSSTMIFLSLAEAAARRWTIPMPCSPSLIRFWPPTAQRLFKVWASTPTSAFSTAPGPGAGASPSTSWKSCALFTPTVLCSPASTRKS